MRQWTCASIQVLAEQKSETLITVDGVLLDVTEELVLTLDALRDLWESRGGDGLELLVYDYALNEWRDGAEAFDHPGTYERAVLRAGGRPPVRVLIVPRGTTGLSVDASSVGQVGLWRTMGVDLMGRHTELLSRLVEGRVGSLPVAELVEMLSGEEASGGEAGSMAREARRAIEGALPSIALGGVARE